MAKGAAIPFKTYKEGLDKLLDLIKLDKELKKHHSIVLKVSLFDEETLPSTKVEFVESVLEYCIKNKNPVASIFIAEGSEGVPTEELFERYGYNKLAEKYEVGLVDLNSAETKTIENEKYKKFQEIKYPELLLNSFVISLPMLDDHPEYGLHGSLANMLGAFPAKYYKGFFSSKKNKMRKYPIKYAIHDILICKMPELAIIDASEKGKIIAGVPMEMDLNAQKLIGLDENDSTYLRTLKETFLSNEEN